MERLVGDETSFMVVQVRTNYSEHCSYFLVHCLRKYQALKLVCDVTMSSSDDDVPLASVKKKKIKIRVKPDPAASSSSSAVTKKRKHDSSASSSSKSVAKQVKTEDGASAGGSKSKSLKKLDKSERLQYAMQSFLWWNSKEPPPGCQWLTMEHAGVSFPEPYVPHGIKMRYQGEPVDLTPLQEEA